ncbi:MAG: DUF4340 domain-containing protein [Verrucomicrobiota bacterium]
MKIRTTLLLLLLTAGLISYIVLHERKQPPRNLAGYLVFDLEGDILADGQVTPEVKAEDVGGVDLKSGAGNLAFRKQADGTWDISRGLKDRAGTAAITTLLDFVSKAKILDTIDDREIANGKVRESALGLDDSSEIELTYRKPGGGKLVSLRVGRTAPLGNAMYVRFDNVKTRKDVYIVHPDLHEFLTQPADAYRDQSLVKYPVEQLRKFSVKRGEGVIEIGRGSIREEDAALWVITRPLTNARADQELVTQFLKEMTKARIQSFSPAGSGSAAPAGPGIVDITFWGGADSDKKGTTLSFYPDAAPDSGLAICRDSDRRVEFKVNKTLVDDLAQIDSPDIFRDQHLGNIDPAKVTTLEVELAGGDSVQLYRIGGNWVVRQTGTRDFMKADEGQVQSLILGLNESRVAFASDTLTDKALYGFDKPFATLTFATGVHPGLKQLGPVTTENSRVLRFGLPPGKPGYANFAGEPYVYKVEPEVFDLIPRQLIRWRTLQLPSFDPQELRTLRQSIGAAPPVELNYEALKFAWTAVREGQDVTPMLNTQAAERMVPVLASLEVAGWQSESGVSLKALTEPPIVIEASYGAYAPKASTPHTEKIRLEFAPMNANGPSPLYYGRHSGVPGIFLIKAQTVQELIQPLLKAQP